MGARVVIADDERSIMDIHERIVVSLGHSVIGKFSTGSEAWRKIQAGLQLDLLITDNEFGEEDFKGEKLVNLVLEHFPNIKILMISGNVPQEISVPYLSKPYSLPTLKEKIDRLIK